MDLSTVRNGILRRLSAADFDALCPSLELVQTAIKQDLLLPGAIIDHVYFIETGVCSLIVTSEGAEAIEVGLLGREGMSDYALAIGDTASVKFMIQVAGSAYRIPAPAFIHWLQDRPGALQLISKYQKTVFVQAAHTALSHGSCTIVERLSRWLLMSFDRTDGDEIPMVHEFLALMLAVRRAGVTEAIHFLEGEHAIWARRGRIRLRDRAVLIELAAGSYGAPEREYDRLMGAPLDFGVRPVPSRTLRD